MIPTNTDTSIGSCMSSVTLKWVPIFFGDIYQWHEFLLPIRGLAVWSLLHKHKECSLVVLRICVILLVTTAGTNTHYKVQRPEWPCTLFLLSTNDKPMNFVSNGGWSGTVCRYPPVCGSAVTAFNHITEQQLAVCFQSHGGHDNGFQKPGYKTNILL